jgi:hypothetical protein
VTDPKGEKKKQMLQRGQKEKNRQSSGQKTDVAEKKI